MIDRRLAAALTIVLGVGVWAPAPVAGQARWTPPRTPFGQPDLQGVWLNNRATPLERPAALAGRERLTDEEVAELQRRADRLFKDGHSAFAVGDNVFGAAFANLERYDNANSTASSIWMVEKEFDNRTSLVVDPPDGRIPPRTAEAQRRQAAAAARESSPQASNDVSNALRCITYGVPRFGGRYGEVDFGFFQIVQSPDHVVLRMEAVHEARVIPLDGRPHLSGSLRQWGGDSRGRWEGTTLVVETTNFSPRSNFMGAGEHLRLIERFTRVAPDTISYEVRLEDATTWTKPWTVVILLKRTPSEIYEFACHEGNYSMLGILAGARADEQAAQGAAPLAR